MLPAGVTHESPTALETGRVISGPLFPLPVFRLGRADVVAAVSFAARVRPYPRLPRIDSLPMESQRGRAAESDFAPCLAHDLPPAGSVAAALQPDRPRPRGCLNRRRPPRKAHQGEEVLRRLRHFCDWPRQAGQANCAENPSGRHRWREASRTKGRMEHCGRWWAMGGGRTTSKIQENGTT